MTSRIRMTQPAAPCGRGAFLPLWPYRLEFRHKSDGSIVTDEAAPISTGVARWHCAGVPARSRADARSFRRSDRRMASHVRPRDFRRQRRPDALPTQHSSNRFAPHRTRVPGNWSARVPADLFRSRLWTWCSAGDRRRHGLLLSATDSSWWYSGRPRTGKRCRNFRARWRRGSPAKQ